MPGSTRTTLDALIHGPIESMIAHVARIERDQAKRHLLQFTAIRLDFTDAYLDTLGTEQLRHVLLAAMFQARRATSTQQLAVAG